jgi:acyl-coenzyme A thioesterase PaaI-like protein
VAADKSWASTLGLVWSKESPGLVSTFTPAPEHRGPPGFLHGGVAAAVLDETMAALSITADGWHSVTAKLELRYRCPVPLDGRPIRVEAWRDGSGGRRAQKIHGRLLTSSGVAAVEATGLFVRVDAEAGDE